MWSTIRLLTGDNTDGLSFQIGNATSTKIQHDVMNFIGRISGRNPFIGYDFSNKRFLGFKYFEIIGNSILQ